MANSWTDVIAELKEVAGVAVGLELAVPPALNLLTAVQGAKRSFVEQLREANPRLQLPLLIFDFGTFKEDTDLAINSVGWSRMGGSILYVCRWGIGNQDLCYAGAAAIKAAIDSPTASFTNFEPKEEGIVYSNVDAPLNASLFADSQTQCIAAAVTWQPGFRVAL